MSLQLAGVIAVQGIFYSTLAFVIAVSTFWPWWKSQLGWTIIAKSLALTGAVVPAMLVYWFGVKVPVWLSWVSVIILWAIPPILAWRAYVIWKVQRKGSTPV